MYTETKPDTRKVVPTWNYSAVQVYGKLSLYYDSKTFEAGAFLHKHIRDLLQHTEETIIGYATVDEAPEKYVELLQRNIVEIEIRIEKIQGKFKTSQQMKVGDREGVAMGFAAMGGETGKALSKLVKERGLLHDAEKQ
ncbi:hypothetical protein N7449_000054 [Penicillium cf. viridicatum]|uniref:Transcriptional regulator n=1 Tax=Penicillium cf. viridicatum TaxID=2972119 RepID=A0A9W9T8X8_9EURO|nr:hypothetical protein N7449_000054 [Penicillium cf. viridicatum]